MATVKEIKATARPKAGKGAARAERRAGRTPGVIYGDNKPPVSISLDHIDIRTRIYAGRFLTTLYDIELDGKKAARHPARLSARPGEGLSDPCRFHAAVCGRDDPREYPGACHQRDQSPGVKRGGAVNIVSHTIPVMLSAREHPAIDRRRRHRA